jgi:DNA ligase 1
MKLPTLYKKTSTGAIQFWNISTSEVNPGEGGAITTTYGQYGTESPQTTFDLIKNGKNVGKKNETSALQQAELEAQAQWEKKKKKGYVESIKDAQGGKLDALITGGIEPMLAHKFADQAHKIKYPCFVQPKLDGIRCVAIIKDGACTLWSRTRKPITSCPHIVQELEAAFETRDIVLDGELYNHDFKSNFEHIVHLVRQDKKPDPQHTDVQYHVYDVIEDKLCGPLFEDRTENLDIIFAAYEFYSIKQVETDYVDSEDQVMDFFDKFSKQGYEGAMLRNSESKYVNKRSYDLQKVKEFLDDEFDIVDIEEGRGKLAGHVGAFICKMSDGKIFKAKMSGDTERLKDYFENHQTWSGMKLTVKYQGLTSYGIPRFPVGKSIRNYE